ncbi:MAG: glycosyltransferase family 4 protein [Desulfobacterales bacterium]|nr:glycosyltransferase family 4 protein [Desulfobacterales bacterium]
MGTSRLNRRTWLVLAHCFNMDGRAASQTITDKIPYLMEAGIKPVVLSAPTGDRDTRYPHFQILSPAPSGVLFELRHMIKKRFSRRFVEKGLKALLTILCLPFLVVEKLFLQLDSQWSWCISATLKGLKLIRRFEPELIYSTAGPPSTHATGYFLHRVTGLPWLAEVHDPLIQNDERPRWHNYYFKKWLEKRIWEHASAVVYFTEKARRSAAERNPGKGKAFVLRPGAVAPDLADVHYTTRPAVHLGHFGSLAEDRNLASVIKAVHALIEENPAWIDMLRLDIYGTEPDPVSRRYFRQFPMPGVVNLHGRLEYDPETGKTGRQRVLEAMRKTDVLLLIHGTVDAVDEYIPSKLYEYLLVRRPIIGLVSLGSELETVLSDTGHRVVDQADAPAVKGAIKEVVNQWLADGLESTGTQSVFTVDKTVKALIGIVDGFNR